VKTYPALARNTITMPSIGNVWRRVMPVPLSPSDARIVAARLDTYRPSSPTASTWLRATSETRSPPTWCAALRSARAITCSPSRAISTEDCNARAQIRIDAISTVLVVILLMIRGHSRRLLVAPRFLQTPHPESGWRPDRAWPGAGDHAPPRPAQQLRQAPLARR
jgi:hypothetical protein